MVSFMLFLTMLSVLPRFHAGNKFKLNTFKLNMLFSVLYNCVLLFNFHFDLKL